MVGYEINFNAPVGDPLMTHPLYLRYSSQAVGDIDVAAVKADLNSVLADRASAPVVAYLSWLLRVRALTV